MNTANKKRFINAGMIAGALLLAACGGGGGDVETSQTAALSDSEIKTLVESSNIKSYDIAPNAGTFRWVGQNNAAPAIPVYIPAPANATELDLASKARVSIAEINRKTGARLALFEVSAEPQTAGYLRVSYLTSYVPPGSTDYRSYCANVATGPSTGSTVMPDPQTRTFNAVVAWINLGNGKCDVTQAIVTHEFGHALGLAAHFQGFGMGDAISTAFWDVLTTLYANPVNTPKDSLTVVRAAP